MSQGPSWPDTVQVLTERLSQDNLPHQVKSCRTLEDKVEKVLDNITASKKISGWLSACGETKYAKSGSMSDRIREQGNVKFGSGDNVAALKLYTESVICAPSGPGLGLALGNRSAALYHLGHHGAASQDILMALQHKFPRNLEYKLHLRHAHCSIRLGQYSDVLEQLEKCKSALDFAKLQENKKNAVIKDISALNNEVLQLQNKQKEDETVLNTTDKEEFVEHNEIAGASRKLKLEFSNDKIRGRYLTAGDSVDEGEVLFQEKPYSCVLLPPFYSSHCHHCLAQIMAPVPCLVCTQPRYCSGECRDRAWTEYHKYECGHLDTLHSVGIGHLAVRTVLVTGRSHLMGIRSRVRSGQFTVSSSDPYSSVFHLQHHLERTPAEEQFQYALTAALLVTMLVKNTSFLSPEREIQGLLGKLKPIQPGQEVPDDQVHYIGGLILRHIVQLVTNAHAVTELVEDDDGSVEQVRLASGIYPAASLMNHSCIPLIVNSFTGNRLTVRNIRSISAGEEVTNCYGPHYRRYEYADRQRMLRDQYGFRCNCSACADNQDRQYLKRFRALRCSKCGGAVIEGKCFDCGEEMKESLLEMKDLDKYSASCDIEMLLKLEKFWSQKLFKHHESLAVLRDRIAKLKIDQGSFREALKMLDLGLEYTEARYGDNSIEMGHELLKYSDVLVILLQTGATVNSDKVRLEQTLIKSLKIFELQNGSGSKVCKEIKDKLATLCCI